MSKIDNTALILELYNFKKGLDIEQEDIERQINYHIGLFNCDENGISYSQKTIINSLTEKLKPFTYDKKVVKVIENVKSIIEKDELFYELEDLFKVIENQNQGMVYRPALQTILDIINENDNTKKQSKIFNELKMYEWIPAVKFFMYKYTTDPKELKNITSDGGRVDNVYSIVEKVEKNGKKGFLTFIGNRWFFIGENIEYAVLSDFISEREDLYRINTIQKALEIGELSDDRITFKIDEDINLGIEFSTGDLYINEEKTDKLTTLETIFDSAIISYMQKNLYPILSETLKSREKFVNLDIVQKLSNVAKPQLEAFAIKHNNNMYIYSIDETRGQNLYQYDSAVMLVNEMKKQFGFDLSDFYKDLFEGEAKVRKELYDREMFITDKLEEVSENIQKLKDTELLEESEELKSAYDILIEEKKSLENDLLAIKTIKAENKYNI